MKRLFIFTYLIAETEGDTDVAFSVTYAIFSINEKIAKDLAIEKVEKEYPKLWFSCENPIVVEKREFEAEEALVCSQCHTPMDMGVAECVGCGAQEGWIQM